MSLLAHPEILRRRRIWDEKEFIEPQYGRRTPEEVEADRQRIIKEEIARREREHQLHLAQFNSEGVYATDETHIVFVFAFLLVCMLFIIYPWNSTPALWKPEHYTDGKNVTAPANWEKMPEKMRKSKAPPLPIPSPVPNPRRLDVKSLFLKKRPKRLPAPAIAIPIVRSKKTSDLASKEEEEKLRLQDNQLGPTPSSTQGQLDDLKAPPSPTQTQGSQDWTYTISQRVSKRLEKGRKTL